MMMVMLRIGKVLESAGVSVEAGAAGGKVAADVAFVAGHPRVHGRK